MATDSFDINKERRRSPRSALNRPARIRVNRGPKSHAQLMDISPYGASLFYSKPLRTGTSIKVEFHLNTSPNTVTLKLMAQVQRTHLVGGSNMVRITFVDPPLDAIEAIYEYTRHKRKREK